MIAIQLITWSRNCRIGSNSNKSKDSKVTNTKIQKQKSL